MSTAGENTSDPLTPRELACLKATREIYSESGLAPTLAQICARTGVSNMNAVRADLMTLADKGYLLQARPTPGRLRRSFIPPDWSRGAASARPESPRTEQCLRAAIQLRNHAEELRKRADELERIAKELEGE